MKPEIHPEWYPEARVTCSCGNTFTVGATVPEFHTELCSACHPFFTGEQRIVDTAGQVDRFMKRLEAGVEQRESERARRERKRLADRDAKRRRRGLTPLQAKKAAREKVTDEEAAAEGQQGASAES